MSRRIRVLADMRFTHPGEPGGELSVCPAGFEAPLLTLSDCEKHHDVELRRDARRWRRSIKRGSLDRSVVFFEWRGLVRQAIPGKNIEIIDGDGTPRRRPASTTSDLPLWAQVQ